jgi:transposase
MPSGCHGQNWPAYYASQINEKPLFFNILGELSKEVVEPDYLTGRRPFPLRDMVISLVYKVYSNLSSQRFQYDLREVQAKGLIGMAPSPNTLSEYMRDESLTDVLRQLVTKSSLPLAGVETVFAADSTGFSIPIRRVWFNRHTGRREKRRDYMKLHVMVGVGSNIITCAETSEGSVSDRTLLGRLVEGTARYFDIAEVSADAGYLSGENMRSVLLAGGIPYIAFYKNCALDADYKSTFWKDMLYLYKTRHPRFMDRYYLRNNVEASFASMKAKFGDRLRSKSTTGQFNEALCKALCHNICVLIHSMHELKIDPTSWAEVKVRPEAATRLTGVGLERRQQDFAEIKIAAAGRESHVEEKTGEHVRPSQVAVKKVKRRHANPSQASLFESRL